VLQCLLHSLLLPDGSTPDKHQVCVAACCSVLQRVSACCSVLQCVAVGCCVCCNLSSFLIAQPPTNIRCVLQCVAVCCSVCCSVLQRVAACFSVLQCVVACFSVWQCVAVRGSGMQCLLHSFLLPDGSTPDKHQVSVAVCCSVLQRVL